MTCILEVSKSGYYAWVARLKEDKGHTKAILRGMRSGLEVAHRTTVQKVGGSSLAIVDFWIFRKILPILLSFVDCENVRQGSGN